MGPMTDTIRQTVEAFIDGLRDRHPLTITDDVDIAVTANLETQELFVKLSGKTPYGNAYLAKVLERMGELE
jgi:hypothetical protein